MKRKDPIFGELTIRCFSNCDHQVMIVLDMVDLVSEEYYEEYEVVTVEKLSSRLIELMALEKPKVNELKVVSADAFKNGSAG